MKSGGYKVIIADDESLVRERISKLIENHWAFELCAECADGAATIDAVKVHQPHLLFLDIQMPKASGFDVLEKIISDGILIVFITAHEEYAIKAFEYAAFDYLLKPITEARFQKTIKRLITVLENRRTDAPQSIKLRIKGVIQHIQINDITHLEASDNHVFIHQQKKAHKKRITLRRLIDELSKHGFVQVHRSFAIHPQHIQEMVRIYQGDYLIRLTSGKVIPTSKSYRENVKRLYE
jgi:two-component system LytT family response regulator